MSRIFFDSNLFIYLFEDEKGRGQAVARLLNRMHERRDQLVTSTMTLAEILVRPYGQADHGLAQRYEALLQSPEIELVSFDPVAARRYARIRQDKSIKSPDAIQLACAAAAQTDLFISNDSSLTKKSIDGIQFVTTLDSAPL